MSSPPIFPNFSPSHPLNLALNIRNPRHTMQTDPTNRRDLLNLRPISVHSPTRKILLTHCCSISVSSILTPMRRVPRKCQCVSRGRFCIMMPARTVISVSTSDKMLWSDRNRP